jgi:S-adenosylmethionine:tRNA ribosyltransferase-isomerase
MQTSDFDYNLPKKFIAQKPTSPRDHSKLLVYERASETVHHKKFFELADILCSGDVLVINESKVIPARLQTREGREIFLAKERQPKIWECLVRGGKHFSKGTIFEIGKNFTGKVLEILESGERVIKFYSKNFTQDLEKYGASPLPPYIHQEQKKVPQYQTVYAKNKGSVAAPTAGLHFTKRVFEKLKKQGIKIEKITLHVGLGTFAPMKVDNIKKHKMHSEFFVLPENVAERLNNYKKFGRRIIAVGSTSCRVLESCTDDDGKLYAKEGETDIFIYPGQKFRFIDGMLTNFHLPKSTLIMLIAAFIGREKILELYEVAKKNDYRFFSFGDAMLLL